MGKDYTPRTDGPFGPRSWEKPPVWERDQARDELVRNYRELERAEAAYLRGDMTNEQTMLAMRRAHSAIHRAQDVITRMKRGR